MFSKEGKGFEGGRPSRLKLAAGRGTNDSWAFDRETFEDLGVSEAETELR